MKKLSILLFTLFLIGSIKAQENHSNFEIQLKFGPSFLSYGDIWGTNRGIALQYGTKWFTRFEYNFGDYETSFYTDEFYRDTKQLTTQTKYFDNFISGGSGIEYDFGFKLLEVKDIVNTIKSYQLGVGRRVFLIEDLLSINLYGNFGIYKLTRISPSIIIQTVTISNSFYYMEDVTLIGTFTNSFLDYNWGFGTEFEYQILKNRLTLNLFAKASLGDARFFDVGLGTNIRI